MRHSWSTTYVAPVLARRATPDRRYKNRWIVANPVSNQLFLTRLHKRRYRLAKSVETVDSYIAARSAPVRATLEALREFVHKTLPEAAEGMKWGAPVFFNASGKPVVYLYGGVDHANLGFLHGAQLDDPDRILKGNGVSGRHVKFYPDEAISKVTLEKLLRQCAKLK